MIIPIPTWNQTFFVTNNHLFPYCCIDNYFLFIHDGLILLFSYVYFIQNFTSIFSQFIKFNLISIISYQIKKLSEKNSREFSLIINLYHLQSLNIPQLHQLPILHSHHQMVKLTQLLLLA